MDPDKIIIETIKSWDSISTEKYATYNSATTFSLNQPQWSPCLDQFDIMAMSIHGAKIIRGFEIASMLPDVPKAHRILDYGCGEGYVTYALKKYGFNIIGYDVKDYETWEKYFDRIMFSNDIDDQRLSRPYDLIILYDVIDHMDITRLVETFSRIRKMLDPNGHIFLRCHPFSSRHGRHLMYNKSHVHLVLNNGELTNNNIDIGGDIKVTKPHTFYDDLFKLLSFKTDSKLIHNTPVDEYVTKNLIEKIKINHYNLYDDMSDIKANLSVDFIDYLIRPI